MGRKIISIFIITLFWGFRSNVIAQELNANVTINSDRIQGVDKNVFATLERGLYDMINYTTWSTTKFAQNEKIDCTFSITVLDLSGNQFKTELFIQARRPVYNSTYVTSILNFRDTHLDFEYQENQTIEFVPTRIESNLIATIAFYCNLILALDFDSFAPLGGSSFFRAAQTIAMQAQSTSWKGWSTFDDNRSKTSIINAYMDDSAKPLRDFWYTYHRKGLDEMPANADRARTTILNGLPILKDIRNIRDSEIVLQMFGDCKLEEIVSLSSKATSEEKKSTYDLLRIIYPASDRLEPLKK